MKKIVIFKLILISFFGSLTALLSGNERDSTSDTVYYVIKNPPSGYDSYNASIPHGKVEVVSYYSSTVGKNRNVRIYLPPNYSSHSEYPVLYLLHGIGGDINEWYYNGNPHYILDNLIAMGKAVPMIVVLPNGRAMEDDSPGSNIFAPDKVEGFARFEKELITDLIPFIDTTYAVKRNRESRAIAGLSMGGGQALNFGLAHLDTFAWVGAFSAAPNTYMPEQLVPNADSARKKLALLWISCGKSDNLLYISERTHNYLQANNVPHVYYITEGVHDFNFWKKSLYHFAQIVFQNYRVSIAEETSIQSKEIPKFYFDMQTKSLIFGDNVMRDIFIYDGTGRVVKLYKDLGSPRVFVGNLARGVYFVRVVESRSTEPLIAKGFIF